MVAWLHESRLVRYDKRTQYLYKINDEEVFSAVVIRETGITSGYRLPVCYRNAIIDCVNTIYEMSGSATTLQLMDALSLSQQSVEKALSDTINLGLVDAIGSRNYHLTPIGFEFSEGNTEVRKQVFRNQSMTLPIFSEFVGVVHRAGNKGVSSTEVASRLLNQLNLELSDATVEKLGGILGNWAQYSDLVTRFGKLCYAKENSPQRSLF